MSNGVPSGFNAIDANSYQFTITPSGFGDIELQVDAGAATDGAGNPNISSALVTVKSNLVEKTTLLIEDFLGSRSRSILQQRPDLIGFLDGTFERVSPKAGNLQSYFSATEDGMNGEFAFSTSLNQLRQLGLDQDGLSMGLNGETQSPTKKGSFDVWTEVHGALSKTAQNSADNLVATFGGHYFVTPDLLIGGTVQLDWASQRDLGNANSIGGRGWMAGPYLAAKLPDQNIYFEAGALWGKSDNWVSPVGTFTDNFTTERWMAHAKIAGEIEVGNLTIVPEASYSHFDETQHAYTDSLSNPIASQHLTLGELNIGPKFTWTVDLDDGSRFVPSVGLSSITSFGTNAGTRGKLLFGFEHKNALGWALSADGYYDGIGQQGFDAVGGNIKLNVPLN